MSWTAEKEVKLRELWKKGHTASQIASVIGDKTRNAIIGKAHRLNLESRTTSTKINNRKHFWRKCRKSKNQNQEILHTSPKGSKGKPTMQNMTLGG